MRISDWSSDVCSPISAPFFLFGHMRDFARHRVAVAQHRELAGIDAGRAIFARLVDADHRRGAPVCPGWRVGHAADVGRRRSKVKTSAAAPSEKRALKPASELPSSVHCGTRSEERRVGKTGCSTCRCRGSPSIEKKKKK